MMICKNCGTQSEGVSQNPPGKGIGMALTILGAVIVSFSVFLYFVVEMRIGCAPPLVGLGCLAAGWWMPSKAIIMCEACQAKGSMVPLGTPMGTELAHRFNQPFKPNQ